MRVMFLEIIGGQSCLLATLIWKNLPTDHLNQLRIDQLCAALHQIGYLLQLLEPCTGLFLLQLLEPCTGLLVGYLLPLLEPWTRLLEPCGSCHNTLGYRQTWACHSRAAGKWPHLGAVPSEMIQPTPQQNRPNTNNCHHTVMHCWDAWFASSHSSSIFVSIL